jgi:pimeloyl-ACP methyl ester carboxylesterase
MRGRRRLSISALARRTGKLDDVVSEFCRFEREIPRAGSGHPRRTWQEHPGAAQRYETRLRGLAGGGIGCTGHFQSACDGFVAGRVADLESGAAGAPPPGTNCVAQPSGFIHRAELVLFGGRSGRDAGPNPVCRKGGALFVGDARFSVSAVYAEQFITGLQTWNWAVNTSGYSGVMPCTFSDEELRQMRLPVLMLIGDHDRLNPPKALELARQTIPHLEAEIIPQAGHFLSMEQPGRVDARVLKFLAEG